MPRAWALYVECMDSNNSECHVVSTLHSLGILPLDFSAPIIPKSLAEHLDFGDESIFPGFDSIWFLEGDGAGTIPPDFDIVYAAFSKGSLPTYKKDGAPDPSWDQVELWMINNKAILGVATSSMKVAIYRAEARM